jgi:hypothetical protein
VSDPLALRQAPAGLPPHGVRRRVGATVSFDVRPGEGSKVNEGVLVRLRIPAKEARTCWATSASYLAFLPRSGKRTRTCVTTCISTSSFTAGSSARPGSSVGGWFGFGDGFGLWGSGIYCAGRVWGSGSAHSCKGYSQHIKRSWSHSQKRCIFIYRVRQRYPSRS